ncbi:MAG: PQQ-binding-like beta-propeller repeat protein [Prolixibacteraceae bacterium]|nr:PQQ-binding-like beta-propeller repeat protein [Prolixibacteraceae bacterium]
MAKTNHKENNHKPPLPGDYEGLQGNLKKVSLNTAIISAIFAVVISTLLLLNYLQLAKNDPTESTTLTALTQRLADDPGNEELKEEIRAFDLMARKAFFTAKWQVKTAGWLLLICGIVLVVSLRYYFSLRSKIDLPENSQVSEQAQRILSSKWILYSGSALIIIALIASYFSVDQLKGYDIETFSENTIDESIEVIDLTNEGQTNDSGLIENEIEEPLEGSVTEPEATITTDNLQGGSQQKPVDNRSDLLLIEQQKKQSNSFRGPLGQGVFYVNNISVKWDVNSGENIKWKVEIPLSGYNSPIIWNDKLFLTGANSTERWVYCFDKKNGKLLWKHQANNIAGSPATPPKTTDDTGLAAPSVVTDGNYVVAIFGTGDVVCLNMDGKRIWAKNLGVPDNHYGHSSSLVAWKEKVFVQYDTNKGGRMLALHFQTGEILWDVSRANHISWASPILAEIDGKMQIVTSSEPSVAGHDIETGKQLWKVDCMMGEVGPSPAFANGLVFAANEYATLAAIDPEKGKIVWEDNYYLPEVASPVAADGLLYIATTYGILACYDVHTGNKYWEADYGEGFYSSPVMADGKLFAIDMNGVVHIVKADRELQKMGDIPMGEKVMTTPAFTDGCIFVRGNKNLYCIGK